MNDTELLYFKMAGDCYRRAAAAMAEAALPSNHGVKTN